MTDVLIRFGPQAPGPKKSASGGRADPASNHGEFELRRADGANKSNAGAP
jgi:hypothetical protein